MGIHASVLQPERGQKFLFCQCHILRLAGVPLHRDELYFLY